MWLAEAPSQESGILFLDPPASGRGGSLGPDPVRYGATETPSGEEVALRPGPPIGRDIGLTWDRSSLMDDFHACQIH